jgi:hypothetical protein
MKLVWLSLVLSTAGEGVSNSSKSETYAQRNGLGTFFETKHGLRNRARSTYV